MASASPTSPSEESNFSLALIFSLTYFLLLFPLIGIFSIGSSSEAREVHIAKLMFETGDWILPLRDGLLPSKPPLFHWLTAALGHVIGFTNEFTARLVSLLFASATIFLTVFTAVKFAVGEYRRSMALASALFIGTTYSFLRLSADCRVDMVFCFFVSLAVCVIVWPITPRNQRYAVATVLHRRRDFMWFYAACLAAVLTKGPLGIVLPGVAAFALTCWYYGIKTSFKLWLNNLHGLVFFTLLAPLWYYLAFERQGYDFIAKQLLFENIERFSGEEFIKNEPFWFYVPSILRTAFPWSLFFIYLLFTGVSDKVKSKEHLGVQLRPAQAINCMLVWFFSGFLFFSAAAGKRHAYLVPLFIPMSIYLAGIVYKREFLNAGRRGKIKNFLVYFLAVLGVATAILPGTLPIKDPGIFYADVWINKFQDVLTCLFFIPLSCKIFFKFFAADKFWSRDSLIYVSLVLGIALSIAIGLGIKNSLKNFENSAADIRIRIKPGEKIYLVRQAREEWLDPLMLYLDRQAAVIDPFNLGAANICNAYYIYQKKYQYLFSRRHKVLAEYKPLVESKKNEMEHNVVLGFYDCSLS